MYDFGQLYVLVIAHVDEDRYATMVCQSTLRQTPF